jgi:prepilin-type processing-associated H-X9-DG protein
MKAQVDRGNFVWFSMLVVAGILYAIFLPIYRGAMKVSGRPICINNIKRQSIALRMYLQDYDGFFPHRSDLWTEKLYPYTKNGADFRCPSLGRSEFGYTFDSHLAGKDSETLADPEKTSVIFESQNRARNATSPGTGFSTRHNGFGSVGFADGHAKSLKREAFDALPAPRWKESKAGEAKKVAEDAKR